MKPSILCIIDLRSEASKVLEVAASVAQLTRSRLIIVFPYRLLNAKKGNDLLRQKYWLESDAREKFSALKKKIFKQQLQYEFFPELGFVPDRVEDHLSRDNVDLIVIGNRQVYEFLADNGISIQDFSRQMNIPLLVVPDQSRTMAA